MGANACSYHIRTVRFVCCVTYHRNNVAELCDFNSAYSIFRVLGYLTCWFPFSFAETFLLFMPVALVAVCFCSPARFCQQACICEI